MRTFGLGPRKKVDDTPYGGGGGMVRRPEPVYKALRSVKGGKYIVLLTPQGKTYKQETAEKLVLKKNIVLICGHYEGFDERIRKLADLELSIGGYVLTGG